MSNTDRLATVRATTPRATRLQTYRSIVTTPVSNMVLRRMRDRLRNLHPSKKPQTDPSPSAPTSTSIEQETSASHKPLASDKLASNITLAGIPSDTNFIPPKAASTPASSSLSSTSQVATTQQTTPLPQQPIGTVTNFSIMSNINSNNT